MIYLSPNFTYEEMTRTSVKGYDNTPTKTCLVDLVRLCFHILEPAREIYGKPIYINSGYRSFFVNRAVGGVKGSAHTFGRAADIRVENPEQGQLLFNAIKDNPWVDQLLFEIKGKTMWIHVAWSEHPRHQILPKYFARA